MPDRLDVVIVGARCAGAPLAALLARRGLRVGVVEQAQFPRDTLSSHIFEADALAFLDRLGLTGRLRATGAPLVDRANLRIEDLQISVPWPQAPGDVGGMMSVRRHVLDPILADAAAEAGAQVRMPAKVVGLCEEDGRVAGVRVAGAGGEERLRARLVVGADGRGSTVAELCGARRYNVVANQRAVYWGYFEGVSAGGEATFVTHRWGDRFVLAIPADAGLYQVLVWPEMSELERFGRDQEALFADQIQNCEPLARAVAGARRAGKLYGAVRWSGFFRESAGAGWVLTGDAGHFKDPAPGRGIGDAFRQADALAPAIAAGLDGSDRELDRAMARWGRWRDREFAQHYWFANDMSESGAVPAVLVEIVRRLNEQGNAGTFLDLLNHRVRPSQLLTPARLLGATSRVMRNERGRRRAILREVGELLGREARRRWLNHRPAYAASEQPVAGTPRSTNARAGAGASSSSS
jgi:2-polyprenyl-6-methoxyphenol hydroxylase-like FAD-dependent oxidoreductase